MNISQLSETKTQKRLTCLLLCTHVASLTHTFHKLELIQREKFIKIESKSNIYMQ